MESNRYIFIEFLKLYGIFRKILFLMAEMIKKLSLPILTLFLACTQASFDHNTELIKQIFSHIDDKKNLEGIQNLQKTIAGMHVLITNHQLEKIPNFIDPFFRKNHLEGQYTTYLQEQLKKLLTTFVKNKETKENLQAMILATLATMNTYDASDLSKFLSQEKGTTLENTLKKAASIIIYHKNSHFKGENAVENPFSKETPELTGLENLVRISQNLKEKNLSRNFLIFIFQEIIKKTKTKQDIRSDYEANFLKNFNTFLQKCGLTEDMLLEFKTALYVCAEGSLRSIHPFVVVFNAFFSNPQYGEETLKKMQEMIKSKKMDDLIKKMDDLIFYPTSKELVDEIKRENIAKNISREMINEVLFDIPKDSKSCALEKRDFLRRLRDALSFGHPLLTLEAAQYLIKKISTQNILTLLMEAPHFIISEDTNKVIYSALSEEKYWQTSSGPNIAQEAVRIFQLRQRQLSFSKDREDEKESWLFLFNQIFAHVFLGLLLYEKNPEGFVQYLGAQKSIDLMGIFKSFFLMKEGIVIKKDTKNVPFQKEEILKKAINILKRNLNQEQLCRILAMPVSDVEKLGGTIGLFGLNMDMDNYFRFLTECNITQEDLGLIRKKMHEEIDRNLQNSEKKELSKKSTNSTASTHTKNTDPSISSTSAFSSSISSTSAFSSSISSTSAFSSSISSVKSLGAPLTSLSQAQIDKGKRNPTGTWFPKNEPLQYTQAQIDKKPAALDLKTQQKIRTKPSSFSVPKDKVVSLSPNQTVHFLEKLLQRRPITQSDIQLILDAKTLLASEKNFNGFSQEDIKTNKTFKSLQALVNITQNAPSPSAHHFHPKTSSKALFSKLPLWDLGSSNIQEDLQEIPPIARALGIQEEQLCIITPQQNHYQVRLLSLKPKS